jgi:hypothetical protein
VILLLLGWALVQAIVAPPNTLDVLTHHLPRQVYWQQQGGVQHYATSVLRQLTMPPFAELAGLNLLVLSGGDHYHNLLHEGTGTPFALVGGSGRLTFYAPAPRPSEAPTETGPPLEPAKPASR